MSGDKGELKLLIIICKKKSNPDIISFANFHIKV